MVRTVADLLVGIPAARIRGDRNREVAFVTSDSRQAGPDTLFVAVKGTGADGHRYLSQVVEKGCRAVVHQDPLAEHLSPKQMRELETSVRLSDTRPAPALLARELADRPDTKLETAAVTGTNGKTTVAFLLCEMLNQLKGPCGLMGTICYDDGNESIPAPLTTPGGPVFYHWLQRMVLQGCQSVAMELSSHALDQSRCAGVDLSVAVMTNIGRDHLDYHRDIPEYVKAKARILDHLKPGAAAVINRGDPLLAAIDTGDHPVLGFDPLVQSRQENSPDLILTEADLGLTSTRLELDYRGNTHSLESPLVGRFNVENLMAAFGAGVALGFEASEVARALAGVQQVPGRLERIVLPSGGLAVVDYAHTHDALAAVLGACDELSTGRLLVVFGCGGDRDRGKRPLMGQVAAARADATWITSDNPRNEDPAEICAEVAEGYRAETAPRSRSMVIIENRTLAIEAALNETGAGDILVIAGKGHEDYQVVGDQVLSLDDRQIVRHWIEKTGTGN